MLVMASGFCASFNNNLLLQPRPFLPPRCFTFNVAFAPACCFEMIPSAPILPLAMPQCLLVYLREGDLPHRPPMDGRQGLLYGVGRRRGAVHAFTQLGPVLDPCPLRAPWR